MAATTLEPDLSLGEIRNLDYDDPKLVTLRAQRSFGKGTTEHNPIETIRPDEIDSWNGTSIRELLDDLPAVGVAQRTYTVQRGDNPASIAKRFFGDERAGAAILAENGISVSVRGARSLQVGKVLTIPDEINESNLRLGSRLIGLNNSVTEQESLQREKVLRDRLFNDPDSFRFKSMRDRAASNAAEFAEFQREDEIKWAIGPQLKAWDGVLRTDPATGYLRRNGYLEVRADQMQSEVAKRLPDALMLLATRNLMPIRGMFVTGAALGGGTNLAVLIHTKDEIDLLDVVNASITGGSTYGKGQLPSLVINSTGAFVTAKIKGEDPTWKVAAAATGSVVGGFVGSKLPSKMANTAVSWAIKYENPVLSVPLTQAINPVKVLSPSVTSEYIGVGFEALEQKNGKK